MNIFTILNEVILELNVIGNYHQTKSRHRYCCNDSILIKNVQKYVKINIINGNYEPLFEKYIEKFYHVFRKTLKYNSILDREILLYYALHDNFCYDYRVYYRNFNINIIIKQLIRHTKSCKSNNLILASMRNYNIEISLYLIKKFNLKINYDAFNALIFHTTYNINKRSIRYMMSNCLILFDNLQCKYTRKIDYTIIHCINNNDIFTLILQSLI